MCPNMQFGITFWLNGRLDEERLEMTIQKLSQAHPFLRSVIAREGQSEKLYYRERTTSRIEWSILDGQAEIWTDYKKAQKESWNVFEQGGLKVRVYEKDGGMKGALGNYASAMGIVCKSHTTDEIQKAKEVHRLVAKSKNDNKKCMLVLACYLAMDQSLQDAAAIAGLGGLESKTAYFVGNGMFGFGKQKGLSITNLGRFENPYMRHVMFIPPASPATKQTIGVVSVNGEMNLCSSYYKDAIEEAEIRKRLCAMKKSRI